VPLINRIRSVALSPSFLIPLSVAAVTFVAAYDNGSYYLPSRNTLAIAIWWAVIVGVALRALTLGSATRASLVMGGLIAALCAWTFASVFWAPSAENAFDEFNRVSLFLAIFVFTLLTVGRTSFYRWCDGLAIAIPLVALVALISRFFPGTFPDQGLKVLGSTVATRLSFPLGYWNGLAIFVALAIPLLLRIAISDTRAAVRGLAIAPIPGIVCVIYLASSRGGFATAFIGVVVFLALTERRWVAAGALFWAGAGSVAAIATLATRNTLVNGVLGSDLAERQGRSAALLVSLSCLLAGAAYAASREAALRLARRHDFRPTPWLGRGTVVLVVALFAVGVVATHPIRQFQVFKRSPEEYKPISTANYTNAHLLSGRSNGRWQLWGSALEQWESHPVIGNGAGSYEAWWTKHQSFYFPARDAHSLYLESLGELGLPGFALVLAFALGGIGIGVRRSLKSSGDRRVALAALTSMFAAFSAAAGVDWMWELTVVAGVGFVALALICSNGVSEPSPPRLVTKAKPNGSRARQKQFRLGVAALFAMWLLICAQGIPLLSQLRIKDSKAYVDKKNTAEALRAAMDARNLQPWASSPYLQLSLVTEREGRIKQAYAWIEKAIARDSTDYHLWLVASRLDAKLGDIIGAQESLRRAESLAPKSSLFRAG